MGRKGFGESTEGVWNKLFKEYEKKYPDLASEFERSLSNDLPNNFLDQIDKFY
ncbi:MAG: hypothetical protein Ct9H300mP3_01010 [Gammaproteobacteria bacterium]|nr:MAG: hypothetical protein Ct9H300mP3_01010 [Gammaproteobacteria bacterium]